ncbi:MAG: flagellar biosynthesis protein FlhF [Lachnospiraceae bacterium]|nr:flagellar biosynthesis protein FlhF [Lachnospiraceae bacterium]
MIIKKYQAKTEEEAMNLAKAELGESCVSLNVKTVKQKGIKKLFKAPFVEVTVALEEESETDYDTLIKPIAINGNDDRNLFKPSGFNMVVDENTVTSTNTAVSSTNTAAQKEGFASVYKDSAEEVKNADGPDNDNKVSDDTKDSYDGLNNIGSKYGKKKSRKDNNEVPPETEIEAVYELIFQTLIDNEVDEDYVEEIVEEAKSRLKNNTPMDTVLSHIYQRLILRFGEPKTIEPATKNPKVIFFVGTTGVGKTTTIAKIASKLFVEGNKVTLFTSDTYRIAAAEQLHSYANIMNVPFRIIYTLDDFEDGLETFADYDYILVDTVGHSHKNQELKADMKKFIDYSKEKTETEVYLVLAASTKMKDLIHIADSYKEISDYRLIFTKLDETYSFGTIFNLRLHTNAPLSYVTYGQNVPEDIDTFKPQQIVKKLLGGQ